MQTAGFGGWFLDRYFYEFSKYCFKDYFTSLTENHITENKCFSENLKLFLSNKRQSSERIKLTEKDNTLITNGEKVAMKLSGFFSNWEFWSFVRKNRPSYFENYC